jgi:SAM-dependent methyltransferase
MGLPFNRALHPDDYEHLTMWVEKVRGFERMMHGKDIPFRKDHEHRTWEYANVLRQLDELGVKRAAEGTPVRVIDCGAGGSSLSPMLAYLGYTVTVADSMAYGDIREAFILPQVGALELSMAVLSEPVEAMRSVPDNEYDVAMCISVIEHLAADKFHDGLKELHRITKPGGYLFITSDYFADEAQIESSPYKQIQHTAFTPELAGRIDRMIDADFVGGHDFRYRGDFVHNYSFVNLCLRKRG